MVRGGFQPVEAGCANGRSSLQPTCRSARIGRTADESRQASYATSPVEHSIPLVALRRCAALCLTTPGNPHPYPAPAPVVEVRNFR